MVRHLSSRAEARLGNGRGQIDALPQTEKGHIILEIHIRTNANWPKAAS